jgi:hypothetical protein
LNDLGRVVVVDVVAFEVTYFPDKPYAQEIAAWIEAGQNRGSNRPVEIATTETRPALQAGRRPTREAAS